MIFAPPTLIHSPAMLAQFVRDAAGRRVPVIDYGLAHRGLGSPPPPEHLHIAQSGDILEHSQRDFVVRAAAGITLGRLNAQLAAAGQFLPLDADDDLTLGELIAHNVYGSLRAGYGSLRDLLLGLAYTDPAGREIRVGGRTVKNVAGYDVTRFMVGNLNELGLIHEATLKTFAIPETVMTVDLAGDDPAQIDACIPKAIQTDSWPASMILAGRDGRWSMSLGFVGKLTGCAAQLKALELFLASANQQSISSAQQTTLAGHLAALAQLRHWRRSAQALVKIIVPPAKTGFLCAAIAEHLGHPASLRIDALPAFGCIFAGGELTGPVVAQLDAFLLDQLAALGGFRAWHALPHEARDITPIAPAMADWPMLQRLKHAMDPDHLFNPGRFLRGSAVAKVLT